MKLKKNIWYLFLCPNYLLIMHYTRTVIRYTIGITGRAFTLHVVLCMGALNVFEEDINILVSVYNLNFI